MSVLPLRRHHSRPRAVVLAGAGTAAVLVLAGCSAGSVTSASQSSSQQDPSASPTQSAASISSNIGPNAQAVDLSRRVKLRVVDGTLEKVAVTGPDGAALTGKMSPDGRRWTARAGLAPAASYTVNGTAVDSNGHAASYEGRFTTRKLSKDEQTYPSFLPTDGAKVGVGMPVIIRFDVPVTNKASIEKHLQVVSNPPQVGTFNWISGNEVHYRPRAYWQPGTKVTVNANVKNVPAGDGIYGQINRTGTFTVGRAMVSTVNIRTDQMTVTRNGKTLRTIPITTGKAGFTTRSGIKVIQEKYRSKRMNSETIGIDPNSSDGYDLNNVEYALRVTNSGEFVHAAPWSVGSQGYSNVSHGCTGMSTSNAAWFYDNTLVGDVVKYVGSDKPMTLTNGFGDWNLPFRQYKQGSALS